MVDVVMRKGFNCDVFPHGPSFRYLCEFAADLGLLKVGVDELNAPHAKNTC
jgi:hypothetical protein